MSVAVPDAAPRRVLPVIVAAQFAGTSLWFAPNAVMADLQRSLGLPAEALGALSSAVQAGFIAGTLVFALLAIADRHSPRRVFLLCAMLGALANALPVVLPHEWLGLAPLWSLRAATGFFLAGIYPVGMKIAAAWYPKGLGGALGWLVGALVLGTAAPHALRGFGTEAGWQPVMLAVSALALSGGALLAWGVPEGGHLPRAATLQLRALAAIWRDRKLRASVLGYYGHMWEIYTLWVLAPAIVATRLEGAALSFGAFALIGAGALGCVVGGLLVPRFGGARIAAWQIGASGACCLVAPWLMSAPGPLFAAWLLVWGITVAGDSPQFSALTASNAPREAVGSVLTLVNCVGFAISIVSIQLFTGLAERQALSSLLPWIGIGPLLGLLALRPLLRD